MKKAFLVTMLVLCVGLVSAQAKKEGAQIEFEKTAHDFGKFSESNPTVSCTFTFTNTGDKPLVIVQAQASCGCTVPEYPKGEIKPGGKGTIKVTYNGAGRYPGVFAKTITIRSNAKPETTRLVIKGEMLAKDNNDK